MFFVIHGTDLAASRLYFLDILQKKYITLRFDGNSITETDVVQSLEGGELFASKKAIAIENLLSKKRQGKELQNLLSQLQKAANNHDIVLWEEKQLSKQQLKNLSTATIKECSYPVTLFLFLETLFPRNGKKTVLLFHQTLQTVEPEVILFLLIRHVRLLLALSSEGSETIDEIKTLAPWQKSKLRSQASRFSQKELIDLYQKLYQLDLQLKTGALPFSLPHAIDILLLDI